MITGLAQQHGEPVFELISRCYGFEDSDLGPGLVLELVRDADGQISQTLKAQIWGEGYTPDCQAAVETSANNGAACRSLTRPAAAQFAGPEGQQGQGTAHCRHRWSWQPQPDSVSPPAGTAEGRQVTASWLTCSNASSRHWQKGTRRTTRLSRHGHCPSPQDNHKG